MTPPINVLLNSLLPKYWVLAWNSVWFWLLLLH
jgi:hypothetical protein